jgi:hypothetical protein
MDILSNTNLLSLAGFAATGGLIFTAITFYREGKTRQVQTANEIIDRLLNLEEQLTNILAEFRQGNLASDVLTSRRNTLVSIFCNRLDWFAFLILKKRIKDKSIINYFIPSFTKLCEDVFCSELVPDAAKSDDKRYTNLKKLYKIKNNKKLCSKTTS